MFQAIVNSPYKRLTLMFSGYSELSLQETNTDVSGYSELSLQETNTDVFRL